MGNFEGDGGTRRCAAGVLAHMCTGARGRAQASARAARGEREGGRTTWGGTYSSSSETTTRVGACAAPRGARAHDTGQAQVQAHPHPHARKRLEAGPPRGQSREGGWVNETGKGYVGGEGTWTEPRRPASSASVRSEENMSSSPSTPTSDSYLPRSSRQPHPHENENQKLSPTGPPAPAGRGR